MKTPITATAAKALALAALLIAVTFSQQALAAAKAPDIDPKRSKIDNMVYPPGHKPTKAEIAAIKARSETGKKSTAVTIAPKGKPKPPAKQKDNADD